LKNLNIIPINVATLNVDKSEFTYMRNFGVKLEVPCIIWYIQGADKKIMVDTGPCDPDWSNKYHFPMIRSKGQEPRNAMKKVGLDPKEIDIVILSHLHWDHAFNNHLFPNATFYVQKEELKYAIAPLPVHMKGYESVAIGMSPDYITKTKYTIINGDLEIVPGVSVVLTPGHSPGSMCVKVETSKGPYLIASDTLPLFENWNNPVAHIPRLPGAIHVGLVEYFESLEKMDKITDLVLPGHDPLVFDKTEYP
jgi:N-acyl homoserine lactone hydrolase